MLLVQCDFDDTITVGNVSTAIREVFGPDRWQEMEADYLSGRLSVEESNIRQFALVSADRRDIEAVVLEGVVIRYGFEEFVDYCQGEGIRLVIVSSGLDLYIRPVLRHLGLERLETYSGKARVIPGSIEVAYADPSGALITRGFKESHLRRFKEEGNTVVYVGDGLSDIAPAREADFVVARSTLAEHCKRGGLTYYGFDTFNEVAKHVEEIRRQLS